MVASKRTVTRRSTRRAGVGGSNDEPDIYRQMLAEAGEKPQSPLDDKRHLNQSETGEQEGGQAQEDEDEDEELEFQDVILPNPTVQTLERDSDEEDSDDDEDLHFEDVDFVNWLNDTKGKAPEIAELELNLTAQQSSTTPTKRPGERRKPITKEEKDRRIAIHKTHLLCLLSHVARRNHWCNDHKVQESLRPHLTDKTVHYLNPESHLPQFGQAESLKNGLKQAADVWKSKFEIKERGLRRALWAEDVEQLKDYEPLVDMDSCLDRADFREAAGKLQGSRDVGAQLYCALLRSAGVRARLVCSLQPLSCVGGPILPKPKGQSRMTTSPKKDNSRDLLAMYEATAENTTASSPAGPTVRRRLGHPHATAYNFKPAASLPSSRKTFDVPVRIRESPYPVYWVEVLDVGHQKWQPADAVVLHSFWRPKVFEPPITDKENSLCYVVAMEADGTAKDVTRRYAKAYTAKTRKLRVESVLDDGDAWWRKVMKFFGRPRPTDLDQIEVNELAGAEAREPMPRNVQDFKDHPVYALERHLRRHEVLVPGATPSGTVGAGSRGPLEKIYRRKDVRIARSAAKWYRLGREVKPAEIPAKWLPKKASVKRSRLGSPENAEAEAEEQAGTPVYTHDQTEAYEPPPVRNGRVPKNKFGNIEVYVPSMVPRGAVHIVHELAARAALTLGIDYAPALTGFQFRGRQGTAVLHGIVVAAEFDEAVRAVMAGLGDAEQEAADERRRLGVLMMWRRLLMGLRIRERIWGGVDEEERKEAERQAEMEAGLGDATSDTTEEFDMVYEEDGEGGGFMME
ncbi:rad4 transglutaminase-like domain-containing protein [Hirsutella rhossiliensis]|uniref:Rad4 transglutaminase-like domain-containing protein n=1 Tax=Hirsutella rhossiliensis TaxID=111463 RepID=A0A9P8MUE6_9HYPO|nr:rad4 transglutaminase-like domain-containing protein [Hirsutella rhossiliensis]KAH0961577.1 rad4 transglutaminase-like domain-containing protein [Hirsutella rhossiliensis]